MGLGEETRPGQASRLCAFDKGEWGEPVKGSCAHRFRVLAVNSQVWPC